MTNIIFLVSGGGGTLRFLFSAIEELRLTNFKIVAVIADRKCGALDFARNTQIPSFLIPYKKENIDEFKKTLKSFSPGIVVTNIHKIIDKELFSLDGFNFINLHYSLLPAFGGIIGMKTLSQAKKKNVKIIGSTSHWVEEKVDEGEIICQGAMKVDWNRPIGEIEQALFELSCHVFLNSLLIITQRTSRSFDEAFRKWIFSPPLFFNAKLFALEFWKKIRNNPNS